MTRLERPLRLGGLALVLFSVPVALVAQDTTQVGADSLAVEAPPEERLVLPLAEPAVPPGPIPRYGRVSFSREAILWSGAETLGDLLTAIPGVFIARAGFLGQPEYVVYGGRGGSALELYWDGLPMLPLGGDSLFHDVGRIRLSYVDRIDVEVLPSTLRVFLVSSRHDGSDARSVIRVTSGDFDTSVFAGMFQKRWPSGLGVNLAADFAGIDGFDTASRGESFDTWARIDWIPEGPAGASYQIRRQRLDRAAADGIPERKGARTDFLFSLFAGTSADGLGVSGRAGLAASTWTDDSLVADQRARQAYLNLRYRRPNFTFQLGGRLADARIKAGADARFGWVPLPGLILSGSGEWLRHEQDRRSLRAHGSAGVFGGPFSVTGTVEFRDGLQAPVFPTDSAQRTVDLSLGAGFATQPISTHVAIVKREPYLPLPYPDLAAIARFDSSSAATYVVADLTLRSSRALSLHGSYATPVSGSAGDLQPPKHGRAELTLRSKFLRTFRSGAFDFKLQLGMEYWSTGNAGFTASGAPIPLAGATFYDALLQLQLVGFTLYWDFRNGYNSPDPYVPGYAYPRSVQTFGVKWEFAN